MEDLQHLNDDQLYELYKAKQAAKVPAPEAPATKVNLHDLNDDQLHELYKAKQVAPHAVSVAHDENNLPYIDKMHPDLETKILGMGTGVSIPRAFGENFLDAKDRIPFLQEKYPDHLFQMHGGEIQMRGKNEKEWKRVNPSAQLYNDPDRTNDVIDNAYGIATGTATDLAARAAGAAVAVPTGGYGTIPAAAVVGGGLSAAAEALRQGIGKLGYSPAQFDTDKMALNGTVGALTPFLFGAGMGKKQALEALAKEGITDLTDPIAKQKLAQLVSKGRGVAERGWDRFKDTTLYNTAEAFSGVAAETFKNYFKRKPIIQAIEEFGPHNYAETEALDTFKKMTDHVNDLGKQHGELVRNSNTPTNIAPAMEATEFQIRQLKEKARLSDAKYNQLQEGKNKIQEALQSNIPADQKAKLKLMLSDLENAEQQIGNNELDKQKLGILNEIHDKVFHIDQQGRRGVPGAAEALVDPSQPINFAKAGRPSERIKLPGMVNSDRAMASKEILGNIADDVFNDPNVSAGVKKQMQGIQREIGAKLNDAIKEAHPGADALNKKIFEAKNDLEKFNKLFRNPGKKLSDPNISEGVFGTKTLTKLKNASNDPDTVEFLLHLKDKYGSNMQQAAEDLNSHRYLQNASKTPISSGGTTSTTRTLSAGKMGGALGNILGVQLSDHKDYLPRLMGTIGASISNVAGGPAGFKNYIGKVNALDNVLKKVPLEYIPKQAIWNMMLKE